jgi:hypothetical protein
MGFTKIGGEGEEIRGEKEERDGRNRISSQEDRQQGHVLSGSFIN